MTCIKRPIFIESDKICISLEPIIFVLHSSWPAFNNVRNPENLFSGIIYGTFVALCSVCVYFPPVSFDGIFSRKLTSLFLFLSSRRKSNSFFALIKNHFCSLHIICMIKRTFSFYWWNLISLYTALVYQWKKMQNKASLLKI